MNVSDNTNLDCSQCSIPTAEAQDALLIIFEDEPWCLDCLGNAVEEDAREATMTLRAYDLSLTELEAVKSELNNSLVHHYELKRAAHNFYEAQRGTMAAQGPSGLALGKLLGLPPTTNG